MVARERPGESTGESFTGSMNISAFELVWLNGPVTGSAPATSAIPPFSGPEVRSQATNTT